ncbi:MAG: Wzz/FepE/Etk N-terminal domain-containing protein [Candidatus Zixiibacteriota bacterium]
MQNRTNMNGKKKNQFDVSEIMTVIWRRKWLIIIPIILISIITFAVSYMITPSYESSTIVWVGNPVKLSQELQMLLGDGSQGYRSNRDRLLELQSLQNEITSSPFLKQLIKKLKLDDDPKLDEAAQEIQMTGSNLNLDEIKSDILLNDLRENIQIDYAGNDQIRITTQSTDPEMAKMMAEELADVFIMEKMKQERGVISASDEFTYGQLEKYENDLQNLIKQKTEFEQEYNKIRLDDMIISDDNRNAIQSEIASTQLDIEEFKNDERELLLKIPALSGQDLQINESPRLKKLKNDIKNNIEAIATLTANYVWTAPEIINHKARMFSIVSDIQAENRVIAERQYASYDDTTRTIITELFNSRSELDISYSRVNSLRLALADLEQKIDLIPEYRARLAQLDREILAAVDLRDKFKNQKESSHISQALLSESKYKIIEPAKVPLAPYKPKRAQIIIIGFLLGVAVGGLAAILRELFDKSFRNVDEIEATIGFPVIGIVPVIESLSKLNIKK